MSFYVKALCQKTVHKSGDYTIHSWSPIGDSTNLKLSSYFTFSTKGQNPFITENKEYELELEEVSYDPKYGGSYRIISSPTVDQLDIENLSREEAFEILMDCTSSERIANNILDAYPNYIELILKEGKESIDVKKIKGVGEVYNSAYAREILAKFQYYKCISEYKDYKFDITDCKNLYDEFHTFEDIQNRMYDSPYYCMCRILKRSFDYADRLLMEHRPELRETKQRCSFAILDVLLRNEIDGSTRIDADTVYSVLETQYNVPELLPLVDSTCDGSSLIYYNKELGYLSIMDTYVAECQIANFVKFKLGQETGKLDIDVEKYRDIDGSIMTDEQMRAPTNLCEHNLSLLIGNSGSGKTSAVKSIIDLCEDNGLTYTLVAPTGKASLRMKESTSRNASTIHYKALAEGEISTDVLIADECSMIDLHTFVLLLNTITNEDIKVVLVGDNAQLLPVGIGCVFNDMINSNKVPITRLTKIFRYNSSGALFVATNTRRGTPFFDSEEVDEKGKKIVTKVGNTYKVGDNYNFIETEDIFQELTRVYMNLISKGVKPSEILCLSPYNVGSVGTYAINNAIQAEINPPLPNEIVLDRKIQSGKTSVVFRNGDRVLNKKNDYKAIPLDIWESVKNDDTNKLSYEDFKLSRIFNGQDGIIRSVDEKKLVVQFDEELIVFDKMKINILLLGYCISVHASQGSEAKYVINVVSKEHKNLNRNMLYVADTRAKEYHWDIGSSSAYNEALMIDGNELRDTWLYDLLIRL